jgi:3-methyladenine DNA glycosylase Mpg
MNPSIRWTWEIKYGLGYHQKKFNGRVSCAPISKLYLTHGEKINRENIEAYERIGIDYAEEDKHLKLRFRLKI